MKDSNANLVALLTFIGVLLTLGVNVLFNSSFSSKSQESAIETNKTIQELNRSVVEMNKKINSMNDSYVDLNQKTALLNESMRNYTDNQNKLLEQTFSIRRDLQEYELKRLKTEVDKNKQDFINSQRIGKEEFQKAIQVSWDTNITKASFDSRKKLVTAQLTLNNKKNYQVNVDAIIISTYYATITAENELATGQQINFPPDPGPLKWTRIDQQICTDKGYVANEILYKKNYSWLTNLINTENKPTCSFSPLLGTLSSADTHNWSKQDVLSNPNSVYYYVRSDVFYSTTTNNGTTLVHGVYSRNGRELPR